MTGFEGEPAPPAPGVPDVATPPEDPPLVTPATEDPELATPAPLWGTDELPVSAYAAGEGGLDERPEADVGDLLSNFQDFQAAWDDAVTTGGTSAELIDDVRADSGLPGHRR